MGSSIYRGGEMVGTREGYDETVRMSPIPSGPDKLTFSWFFRITLKGCIFNSKWISSRNLQTFLKSFCEIRLQVEYIEHSTAGHAKTNAATNIEIEMVLPNRRGVLIKTSWLSTSQPLTSRILLWARSNAPLGWLARLCFRISIQVSLLVYTLQGVGSGLTSSLKKTLAQARR